MPNLFNHSDHSGQQAQLSWLQSSNGEWFYFRDKNFINEDTLLAREQDYIWLVSQATSADKVSGYRVANQTIEEFIEQLADVNQVVVFGVPHEKKGNAIHVYVELNNPATELSTLSNTINAKLASCLGDFAQADTIKFVDQLPITHNKNVSRKILKSQNITMNYAA
ncbi:acyl-CoA synthetase [Colwellia sp. MB02u-10]|jgi:acetyl-CoA synthetase|uniref:acyl-CoA synthetase n=1 Tax=Colwellia sp. MB02u-10 TaxID=2759828 RepID=UPI0015F360CC|nr:acyl-CoA synthetase [Colwellia sp. MB02u-10]MBA6342770.1 acyl-CoA synthetase [Colwellia sp. MB02u-10]